MFGRKRILIVISLFSFVLVARAAVDMVTSATLSGSLQPLQGLSQYSQFLGKKSFAEVSRSVPPTAWWQKRPALVFLPMMGLGGLYMLYRNRGSIVPFLRSVKEYVDAEVNRFTHFLNSETKMSVTSNTSLPQSAEASASQLSSFPIPQEPKYIDNSQLAFDHPEYIKDTLLHNSARLLNIIEQEFTARTAPATKNPALAGVAKDTYLPWVTNESILKEWLDNFPLLLFSECVCPILGRTFIRNTFEELVVSDVKQQLEKTGKTTLSYVNIGSVVCFRI